MDQDSGGWNINFLAFGLNSSGGGGGGGSGGDAPYGGTAAAIPGNVLAENYDTGGQGTAYNVTSVNGTDNGYRSDGVDLEATTDTGGGANDLGWTAAGQWFKYTVNVATAGTYTVGVRLAAPTAVTDGLHIDNSAGTNLSGNVNVPATGGWQTWTTVNATVTLPAGTQTLTVDQDNAGWNINYLAFTAAPAAAAAARAPTGGSLGANVIVISPSESVATIASTLNAIGTQQNPNQFGTQRYEILFQPGTYGSAADPLDFQVGYYESVEGLGQNPSQVVINGTIDSWNQCTNGVQTRVLRHRQLLALDLQPHDQRRRPDRLLRGRGGVGRLAGLADAPGGHQRQHDPDGLLRRVAGLGQRRLHRRLRAQRHRGERLPAAVRHPEHRYRLVDQRGVEPGVLRRPGRPGPEFRLDLPGNPAAPSRTRRSAPAR